jgi:hypothetical protein
VAITFVNKTETAYVASPKVGSEPASVASGDILIATITMEDGTPASIAAPAGWTLLTSSALHPNVSLRMSQAYIVRAGSAPSFTWTWTGSISGIHSVSAYRPTSGSTLALDVEGTWQSSNSAVLRAAITTATADAMKVWAGGDYNNVTDTTTGMTTRVNAAGHNTADATQAVAGASGNHDGNNAAAAGWARIVSFKDVAGGGATLRRYSLGLTGVG